MSFEKLYTVDDVAEITCLSSRTIRTYLKDGSLKGHKIGGQWRFTMQNINDLLDSNGRKNDAFSHGNQFLADFISGVNTDITGELQVCAIADYYCSRVEDTTSINREFAEIQSGLIDSEPEAKYFYFYETNEQKARYIFFGTPNAISLYMKRLNHLYEQLQRARKQFDGRSDNYLSGRPDYPQEFFHYLYHDFGIKPTDIIADIGSGIGAMSKHFLERNNVVYCIEPNQEMKALSDRLLSHHKKYISLLKTAENTSLKTDSVDYIICGNSFNAFDKTLAIPEFNRILKKGGKVIITHYYPDIDLNSEDMSLWDEFKSKTVQENDRLLGKEFIEGTAISKVFYHTYHQDFYHYLSGCLSSAIAPKPEDERYEYLVNQLKRDFDKRSVNDMIECKFRLLCLIGNVYDLIRI